jgi:broad specificity phosphatase PhoE
MANSGRVVNMAAGLTPAVALRHHPGAVVAMAARPDWWEGFVTTPEPPTRLLLIRHGHHDSRGRFLQHTCAGVTEIGAAQARALATRLARDATLSAAVVLASNARRSIDTAEVLAATLGVEVAERTCDLCEEHPGAAEGLTPAEMQRQFGPSYQSVPGAEDFPTVIARVGAALERIAATYAAGPARRAGDGSSAIAVTSSA